MYETDFIFKKRGNTPKYTHENERNTPSDGSQRDRLKNELLIRKRPSLRDSDTQQLTGEKKILLLPIKRVQSLQDGEKQQSALFKRLNKKRYSEQLKINEINTEVKNKEPRENIMITITNEDQSNTPSHINQNNPKNKNNLNENQYNFQNNFNTGNTIQT